MSRYSAPDRNYYGQFCIAALCDGGRKGQCLRQPGAGELELGLPRENLIGSTLYAALLAIVLTTAGDAGLSASGTKLIAIAEAKTNYYASHGSAGMLTVFTKGILCNWMVSLAVVFAFATTSLSGKILAIWGPTVLFFSQGFEHAVVNMFVIPVGMMLGAHVTLSDWWLWNQIPVTLGNLVGGMLFTGLAIYFTHRPEPVLVPQAATVPESAANERPHYSPSF